MVAWAETMVRQRGIDVTGRGLQPYPHACQKAPDAAAPRALGANGVGAPAPGPTLPTWGSPMPQVGAGEGLQWVLPHWKNITGYLIGGHK